jgi:uncharacterized repeat protein (TIGR01451 family)
MKRLLLGLSILSGVATVGIFAFAQVRRDDTTNDKSTAGGNAAPGQPPAAWIQPVPQSLQSSAAMTANNAGAAVGADPFAGALPAGQGAAGFNAPRNAAGAAETADAASGVRIRNVNARQVVEEQGAGTAAGVGADPFASLPSGSVKPQPAAGQRAADPRPVGLRGNEPKEGNLGGPPLPANDPAAYSHRSGGAANPLRSASNSTGSPAADLYEEGDARGAAAGLTTAVGSSSQSFNHQQRSTGAQEPGAFPPSGNASSSAINGQGNLVDRATVGETPNPFDQPFGGASPQGAGGSGNARMPASYVSSSGAGQLSGQLASTNIREGLSLPGGRQLEGNQLPTLAIQKFAPPEIQVNKAAVFEIHVRNTGPVTAREVVIHDRVPQGAQFVRSSPDAAPTPQGDLEWRFDALPPREQRVIKVEVRPLKRGEIGSVATVRFSADASARSKCTCPDLRVEVGAQRQTLVGDSLALTISVANMGDGPATGVVIAEQVPDKFEHAQGQLLENELGTLKPGETRELKLTLKAARPGMALNRLAVRADGDMRVEKQLELEVVAPALEIVVQGPQHQFLQREATYALHVHNPGTAPAKSVQLSALVPRGFQFVAANNYGEFDPKTGRVNWELVELPAGQKDRVELKLVAAESGMHQLQIDGRAQRNVQVNRGHQVRVEGVASVRFEVVHKGSALEVGAEKVYEIKVSNDGTEAASQVQVVAELPSGLQPLGGNGPLQATLNGNRVVFGPLPRLAPRADTSFFVHLRAQSPGDHVVRFQIASAEQQSPTSKEEILKVR